jgi:hypothetical protein
MTTAAAARWPRSAGIGGVLAGLLGGLLGGCTSANMPKLPSLPLLPAPSAETDSTAAAAPSGPLETTIMVPGTPTGAFTQVAHEALGCWFGAGGPLKATHVYRAEAEPPAKGGAAEIVIHERDVSLRDQRGPRAYRISFDSEAAGVRVVATAMRFDQPKAQAMARDVETWAKGGSGCQLRALFPPPAPPPSSARTAKAPTRTKKR